MKKFAFLVAALLTLGTMTGCDDDDNDRVNVPESVQQAFELRFPDATRVEWKKYGNYMIADFHNGPTEATAWFDKQGKWYMTEENAVYTQLPQAVRTAFESGEYASWRVDDVDKLIREGLDVVYVLEVEKAREEYDLYYSEQGVLLRAVPDTDDHYEGMLPGDIPQAVRDFIAQQYPEARIVDVEREKNYLEVDIVDGRTHHELRFGTDNAWQWTKTEVTRDSVPQVVMDALAASQYALWKIDDIDHYTGPGSEWFVFELEEPRTDREVKLRVEADGTIA